MNNQLNEQRVQLRSDLIITSLDDQEGVVLDAASKSYYLVNQTGLFVLNLLDENGGEAPYGAIRNRLLEEFEVVEDEAERDVTNFIKGLSERGLVSLS